MNEPGTASNRRAEPRAKEEWRISPTPIRGKGGSLACKVLDCSRAMSCGTFRGSFRLRRRLRLSSVMFHGMTRFAALEVARSPARFSTGRANQSRFEPADSQPGVTPAREEIDNLFRAGLFYYQKTTALGAVIFNSISILP